MVNSPRPTTVDAIPVDIDLEDFPGYLGRRRKAALTLILLWGGTAVLHFLSWGSWVVLGLTAMLATHALRVLVARPLTSPPPLPARPTDDADRAQTDWPYVSILVAAKNEEAVIGQLVASLCSLDYPADRYEVWIIDDNSSDATPQRLAQLQSQHPQLRVVRRDASGTGGKSGALNQVWPQTQGDFIAVFDADAVVSADLLRQVVPLFQSPTVGAVQVRKTIANRDRNLWTQGQDAEMALDSYFQQQRIALGGIGELRGNGQFVRRNALEQCGGWNEETITDDLDLTLRLHLSGWVIQFCGTAVGEEGVERPLALWHQRNRWAEGGYQRYLDYWRLLAQNRLPPGKALDLVAFWLIQYALPTVALPDFLLALSRNRLPVFLPISGLAFSLSLVGMFCGIRRVQRTSVGQTLWRTLQGNIYMLHWIVVMATMTLRVAMRPKRLRWVKTTHLGGEDALPLDLPSSSQG